MKRPKEQLQAIQQQAMKKTVDGIVDVLVRMYQAYFDECLMKQEPPTDFYKFCLAIKQDAPSDFYARPISKVNNDD